VSNAKQYLSGTHRTRSPAETVRDFGQHAGHCGITRIADITGLDSVGIPVCAAIRPLARSLVVSLGKGIDHDAAMASALMESMETWHAEVVSADIVGADAASLQAEGYELVDQSLLPHFSGTHPLITTRSWITGRELLSGRPILVPFEGVSLNFADVQAETGLLRTSNGLASGNNQDEALVHAICEVIERDAEALWRARPEFRRLDLTTIRDAVCSDLLEMIESAGLRVAVWDITSDIPVPAYGCLLLPAEDALDWATASVHDGFGCHPSPSVALARAITEAAQARLTYISGSRDDVLPDEIARASDPVVLEQVRRDLDQIQVTEQFRLEPTLSKSFYEDIIRIAETVMATIGGEIIWCDLMHPDLNVPVVKVFIPGLEGPWEQAAHGARHATVKSGRL
jgi:YcaO-like protein with predicted kinase domain